MSKKFAIYTAIIGNYDKIQQPKVVDERFDYILFSNDIKKNTIGVWQIRPVSYTNLDPTRICRYIKTHPEELLPSYEASIWIDANICISTGMIYQRVYELFQQKIQISTMWHPNRKCIYEEAFAVVNMMLEHEDVVIKLCHKLRKEKFPQHIGLCETGVLFRVRSNQIAEIDKLWWNCIDNYSRRDQLSFTYVLWKRDIPIHYFLGEGNNVRNTKDFSLIVHNKPQQNHCQIRKNEAWLMRYCWKDNSATNEIEKLYYKLYRFPCTLAVFAIMGQIFRLKYWFKHR